MSHIGAPPVVHVMRTIAIVLVTMAVVYAVIFAFGALAS